MAEVATVRSRLGRLLPDSEDLAAMLALGTAHAAQSLVGVKREVDELWLDYIAATFLSIWPIMLAMAAATVLVVRLLHALLPAQGWPRSAGFALAWALASAVVIHVHLAGARLLFPARVPDAPQPFDVQYFALIAGGLLLMRELAWRRRRSEQSLALSDGQRVDLDVALAQARQALLRAQVEPHFLFNSLATLRRLLRTDPPAARDMLGNLLRYLREALPRLREERSTLGSEFELVRAFLAVHQVRMGPRLRVEIAVPVELQAMELPSMLLLTLVENAIKHGLQPSVDGGDIRVAARRVADGVELEVADTGVGMGAGLGHGTGLANLRARLQATYGEAARFSLQLNQPRGVIARLWIPAA